MKYLRIEEFAEVITGGTPSTKVEAYWNGNIPWLNSGELNRGLIDSSSNFITKQGLSNSVAKMMPVDTVLIALTGATTGVTALLKIEACANQSVTGILPSAHHIPKYLYYYLSSIREKIIDQSYGGAQKHISQGFVKKLIIPLPPLDDQKRIVKILDKADTLRENRKQTISLLDEYLKSTFLEMFGDPVKNPKGWKTDRLNNICHRLSDGPFGSKLKSEHYVEKGVRVIRLQNIGVNKFKDDNKAYISESYYDSDLNRYACKPGEIVIATLGDPNIRACIIPDHIKLSINKADCIHCIPKDQVLNSEYLLSLLNLPQFQYSFDGLSHGETRSRVSSGQLKNVRVPLPKIDLQNKFAQAVQKTKIIKQKMLAQSEELENQFQALMQKAFKSAL